MDVYILLGLDRKEYKIMKVEKEKGIIVVELNSKKSRANPRVFTEQEVYMLATILKSKVAIEVSIRIMDTFVKMKHYINFNRELFQIEFYY